MVSILSQNKKEPMNNNRIKEVRLSKHKTQKDLAKLLGVSEQAIAYYEKALREPPLSSWVKMAEYLNVPTSYLQGISDVSDRTAYSSFEKWLDTVKIDEKQGNVIIPRKESIAFMKEDTLYNFSLLFNAIINKHMGIDDLKKYTKLKDNISNVATLDGITFTTSEVFKLALEAKNNNKKAKEVYSKIGDLISNYLGLAKYDDFS